MTGPRACVTCGDVAVQMRVLDIDEERGLALCEADDGARESVEIALVEPAAAGAVLLVHAGAAIARLDAAAPAATGEGAS